MAQQAHLHLDVPLRDALGPEGDSTRPGLADACKPRRHRHGEGLRGGYGGGDVCLSRRPQLCRLLVGVAGYVGAFGPAVRRQGHRPDAQIAAGVAGQQLVAKLGGLFGLGQCLCAQRLHGDAGDAVPHEAAEGFVGAGVGEVGGGDGGLARRAGDLGEAEVIDHLGAGEVRACRLGGRRALQHLQRGAAAGSVVPEHDAVDAGQSAVREGQREGLGLPHGDAEAHPPADVHPRLPRADGEVGAAIGGSSHREVDVGAVNAAGAPGKVGRSILGVIGDAAQRVGNNSGGAQAIAS